MKFNITLNQEKMIEHKLNVSQWCILDILSVAPIWCEVVSINKESYFWVARQRISDEIKSLDLKPDTIFRYLKQLQELGFIDYEKDGKKDLLRLTPLGKSLFTMSEKNPNDYVGKKSKLNSEKNPTYNYTNSNNYTYIKAKFSFVEEEVFNKLVKHLSTKFKDVTKVRLTNNIKKFENCTNLFNLAVEKMIELDYSGLFIPSAKDIKDNKIVDRKPNHDVSGAEEYQF